MLLLCGQVCNNSKMALHNQHGAQAEEISRDYLEKNGYMIIQQNYKDRFCEIDIIAKNKEFIIFVEVKYRARADFGGAVGAVTPDKLRRMHLSAEFWLSQNQKYKLLQPRLDVVTVVGDIGDPQITHLENIEYT